MSSRCNNLNGSPFSVKSFYRGSTKKEFFHQQSKLRNERALNFKKRPLPSIDKYRLCLSECSIWKWFPRQQFALDFCMTINNHDSITLFAYELDHGKRKYLVTTRKQFWAKYSVMKPSNRHFYEVIKITNSCRLYFDIEYLYEFNKTTNGEDVLKTFIHVICWCLFSAFKIKCVTSDIVDLDSSSSVKFSRHLIFHLKDIMFVNNISCGNFVKDIMVSLKLYLSTGVPNKFFPVPKTLDLQGNINTEVEYLTQNNLKMLIVQCDQGDTFLCDLSVYSKNRNFRLYLSSKLSKHIPLVISKNNEFVFKKKLNRLECNLYRIRCQIYDPAYQQFSDTLVCPQLKTKNEVSLISYGENPKLNHIPLNESKETADNTIYPKHVEGFSSSPYPLLDTFVLDIVKKKGCSGIIRRWMHYQQRGLVIYDIDKNKWCDNIQRQHKSNHVYYVADLKLCHIYQKCHDPDCSGFRSKEILIPHKINPLACDEDYNKIEDFDISLDEELNNLLSEEFDVDKAFETVKCDSTIEDNNLLDVNAEATESDNEILCVDSDVLTYQVKQSLHSPTAIDLFDFSTSSSHSNNFFENGASFFAQKTDTVADEDHYSL